MRSLQPPDILCIHWRVYNFIVNTSKPVLFLPPFWCLCQKLSLCPLYFNKTLLHKSSEWPSLVSGPGLNSSPPGAKHPGVFAWFNYNLSMLYPLSHQGRQIRRRYCGSDSKASTHNVGDLGSIPGSGRSPREGNGNPLQYSCLENPMDGGAW